MAVIYVRITPDMSDQLFSTDMNAFVTELTYDADKSRMPSEELANAILGMTTILKIAGRGAALDFDDVYLTPFEEGSITTPFRFIKKNGDQIMVNATGNVVSTIILGSFTLIGTYGLHSLTSPKADMFKGINPKIVNVCLNAKYRDAVDKVAKPVSEINQKVTIKIGKEGNYEINCENQVKFLKSETEILPDLKNGMEVSLPGRLTRLNLDPYNDLGFEYKSKRLSLTPLDENESIVKYHDFLPTPYVTVHGIVDRVSMYDVPTIKVTDMKVTQPKIKQSTLLENE